MFHGQVYYPRGGINIALSLYNFQRKGTGFRAGKIPSFPDLTKLWVFDNELIVSREGLRFLSHVQFFIILTGIYHAHL